MYLSQLILNPRSHQVQREISNIYQMHRTIMNAFPENLPKDERILFRLDVDRHNELKLLVQSQYQPNWEFLTTSLKDYLLPAFLINNKTPNPAVTQFDLSKTLHPNQILAFRLRANPTVKKDRLDKKQGHRIGIYDETGQLEWLKRKADLSGFRILSVRSSQEGKISDTIFRRNSSTQKVEMLSILFDGILQVVNPIKVNDAIRNGIGSGKGFGFGLLSLARV